MSELDLPKPVGWFLLVKPYQIEEKSKGGIVLVAESKEYADSACVVGQVVAMGDDAYSDPRFNGKRWCEQGDYVLYASHAGQQVKLKREGVLDDDKYLLIKDSDVRASTISPERLRMYL